MFDTSHFHPMLVHFPIALVVFGFLADLGNLLFRKEPCLSKTGFYLLIVGTLSALVAWLTGLLFTADLSGSAGDVKETHELFAWLTLGTLIVTSVIRILMLYRKSENTKLQWLAFILYALAMIFVSITGYYGGTLVYDNMMPL
jgi:uncharacterized membrane protein